MKFNLFKKKSFNDSNTKKKDRSPKAHSPSQSISSLSSSQSSLQTIHDHQYHQETRGIFRTLEPVWSFLPPNQQQQQQWVQLKDHHQKIIENAFFNQQQSTCTIDLMGNNNPMLVYFNSPPPSSTPKKNKNHHNKSNDHPHFLDHDPNLNNNKSLPPMKKKRPVTQLFVPNQQQQKFKSSPNLLQHQHQQPQHQYQENTLYLNYNLRRALVPYWWFEQDDEQGFKGMCRFDQKNQVRLEALSDDRSTLTLTDIAFPIPFQVLLEPADRSSREEWRGFMYLNHQLSVVHPPSPPLLKHHNHQNNMFQSPTIMINDNNIDTLYLDQNDPDDVFYNHDIFLNRRSSI